MLPSARQAKHVLDVNIDVTIIVDSILQQMLQMIEISVAKEHLSEEISNYSIINNIMHEILTTIESTVNEELSLQCTETYEVNYPNLPELEDISEVVTPTTAWNDSVSSSSSKLKLDDGIYTRIC